MCFFKYDLDDKGNLFVHILLDDSSLLKNKEFKSSEELYAFMEKNIGKDGLFDKPIEFRQTNKIDFGMIPQ